jgi:large subunit ribosomal protein L29
MNNMEELRKMSSEDIQKEVQTLKRKLFDLKFDQATGKLTNTAELSKTKKTIARLETVLSERR